MGFPDINLDPGSTSQRLTNNPKFGEWNLLKIQQEKETTIFMFGAWLNGEKQIHSKNQDVQIIKNDRRNSRGTLQQKFNLNDI